MYQRRVQAEDRRNSEVDLEDEQIKRNTDLSSYKARLSRKQMYPMCSQITIGCLSDAIAFTT